MTPRYPLIYLYVAICVVVAIGLSAGWFWRSQQLTDLEQRLGSLEVRLRSTQGTADHALAEAQVVQSAIDTTNMKVDRIFRRTNSEKVTEAEALEPAPAAPPKQ
jgi:hypothetical protein